MTTFALKSYQQTALDPLAAFARAAQRKGPTLAFEELVGQPCEVAARDCPVRFVIAVQVLRMPYASPRGRAALNRAYAHVCEAKFSTAAHELADRLINSMGFEALDVASMLVQSAVFPLFESNQPPAQAQRAQIATDFIAPAPPPELRATAGVTVAILAGEQKVVVTGHISPALEALLA